MLLHWGNFRAVDTTIWILVLRTLASPWLENHSASRPLCWGLNLIGTPFPRFLGLPTGSSNVHPCPFCSAGQANVHVYDGMSVLHPPEAWPAKGDDEFENGFSQCEQTIIIGWADHRRLLAALWQDRRAGTNASRGRALRIDFPELGLQKHDRLEPSRFLRNVALFDNLREFPAVVSFWRRSLETSSRHRSPLVNPAIGCSITRMVQVDGMHTLSLGVYQVFIGEAMHRLFSRDFWNVGATTNSLLTSEIRPLGFLCSGGESWQNRTQSS